MADPAMDTAKPGVSLETPGRSVLVRRQGLEPRTR
jgi:hypothetical protein